MEFKMWGNHTVSQNVYWDSKDLMKKKADCYTVILPFHLFPLSYWIEAWARHILTQELTSEKNKYPLHYETQISVEVGHREETCYKRKISKPNQSVITFCAMRQ